MIARFARRSNTVVAGGAGTGDCVMFAAAHRDIGPTGSAMAGLTGVECRNMSGRFANGNGAVMAVETGG